MPILAAANYMFGELELAAIVAKNMLPDSVYPCQVNQAGHRVDLVMIDLGEKPLQNIEGWPSYGFLLGGIGLLCFGRLGCLFLGRSHDAYNYPRVHRFDDGNGNTMVMAAAIDVTMTATMAETKDKTMDLAMATLMGMAQATTVATTAATTVAWLRRRKRQWLQRWLRRWLQ